MHRAGGISKGSQMYSKFFHNFGPKNIVEQYAQVWVYLGDIYLLHVAIFAHLPKRPLEAKILF